MDDIRFLGDPLKQAVSFSLLGKFVAAVVGILFIHAAFRVLEQTLPRRFGRADARYKVRKFVVFSGYLPILLFLAILFEDRLGRGDVIDIGLLRTTVMETGTWVSMDLYNGRIVLIPNSTVLKGSVFNYSQGFQFVWDEI